MTKIEDLDSRMLLEVAAHRDWVEGWIPTDSDVNYTDAANMVGLVKGILGSGEIKPDQTVELRALGTYVGLAISSATGWPLKQVTDDNGPDLAIVFHAPDGILFPQTLISKRVEAGKDFDVFEVVNGLIAMAQDVIAKDS